MTAKLSAPKIKALASIRESGNYGPARSNTVTALETAKLFYVIPSTTGGFPKLALTRAGNLALDATLAKQAKAPVITPAPVRPLYMRRADAISMFEVLGYGVAENGVWMRSVGAHISTRFFTYTADLVEGNWIACDDEGDPQQRPTNPLADKTPLEIDTRAAVLDARLYTLHALHAKHLRDIHLSVGSRVTRHGGRKGWSMTDEDAVTAAQIQAARTDLKPWESAPTTALAGLAEVEAEMVTNRDESTLIDAEYDRRPWSRFVGVAGGHVHSGMWCTGGTIRPTTLRTWNPTLSGLSVADAVEKLGHHLCTLCFPSAPVEWTQGTRKVDDSCSGSGQAEVPGTYISRAAPLGKCRGCDRLQSMTPRGYVRKHKAPK